MGMIAAERVFKVMDNPDSASAHGTYSPSQISGKVSFENVWFAFNSTLTKIRANQGHSIEVDLNIKSQKPPEILFHGTGSNSVLFILETGLEKKGRNHVHLSSDIETAIKVGQRHGKPFVFEILAQEMHNDNFEFYLSENGVWLTDHVPVKYLRDHAL